MFGLMKDGPRLPYCGMCKTLGAEYGHRSRLILNHDVAFLAEILLDLGGVSLAGSAYQSLNCLSLPRNREDVPVVLRYCAAVSVALAYFRLEDHRRDAYTRGRKLAWSLAARALRHRYRRAAEQLRGWQFPVEEMAAILASQPEREAAAQSAADVAWPTMRATGMVFAHGVRLAQHPDRIDDARRLGSRFGELIYLLDAYEDRDRDARRGQFNPIAAFPREFPDAASARAAILAIAAGLEREMTPAHAARLRQNVEERIGLRPRVLPVACRRPFRDRVRDAVALARSFSHREHAGFVKGALIVASVAAVAFAFPEHARRTESWRQCIGLPMNLMALGAVFASSMPPQQPQQPRQYPMAQPDRPGANPTPTMRSCCGPCKDMCAESCIEGIFDSICGN